MSKIKVRVEIDSAVLNELERRAKREFLSVSELIEDILRRSAVMSRMRKFGGDMPAGDKADPFIEYFSRVAPYYKKKKSRAKN